MNTLIDSFGLFMLCMMLGFMVLGLAYCIDRMFGGRK